MPEIPNDRLAKGVPEDAASFGRELDRILGSDEDTEDGGPQMDRLYAVVVLKKGLLAEIEVTEVLEQAFRRRVQLDQRHGIRRGADGLYSGDGPNDVVGVLVLENIGAAGWSWASSAGALLTP